MRVETHLESCSIAMTVIATTFADRLVMADRNQLPCRHRARDLSNWDLSDLTAGILSARATSSFLSGI